MEQNYVYYSHTCAFTYVAENALAFLALKSFEEGKTIMCILF